MFTVPFTLIWPVESQSWLLDLGLYYIPEVERTQCNGKKVEHYCRAMEEKVAEVREAEKDVLIFCKYTPNLHPKSKHIELSTGLKFLPPLQGA